MGRLVYLMNTTLDGYVASADGSHDWGTVDEELHSWFNDQMRGLSATMYGRRLYEIMAGHWPTAADDPSTTPVELEFARIWNPLPKIVFSTTLERVDHNSRLVRGDVADVLADVRREFDGELAVGGPNLAGQFVRRGLVEEYRVVVHPVVVGAGTPFWPALDAPLPLRLVETHRFGSGVEARTYVPA